MFLLALKINAILLTSFINILLGLLVLIKNPKNRINLVFFTMSVLHGIWAFCLFSYDYPLIGTSLFWIKATYLTVSLHEAFVLIFSFIYPKPIFNRLTTIATAIFIPVYLTFTTWLLYFTNYWVINVTTVPGKDTQTILGPGYTWWLFFIWAALIWALINFLRNSRRSRGLQKVQLQYLFYGFGLWGIAVNIPDVIIPFFWQDTRYFSLSALSSLFFTGFIAYTILRHRFFDIRLVIARSVAYLLLTLTLGIIYAVGLLGTGLLLFQETTTNSNLLVSTIMALIITFTFQPLRVWFERLTSNIFYKDNYNTNDLLQQITYIFATIPNLETMIKKALNLICDNLNINHAAIAIPQKQEGGYEFISNRIDHSFHHLITKDLNYLKKHTKPVIYEEHAEGHTKHLLRDSNIAVFYPLITKKKLIGFLILSHKASGEIYYSQDLKALDIIAPQLAVALQNSQQFDEIKHFNVTLRKKIKESTNHLTTANRELRHLDKLKDEFVFIATHELKTPVTIIKGYLSMLSDGSYGKIPAKIKPAIDEINTANSQLVQLVNNLLEIARTEAKTIQINTKPTEIFPLIKQVIQNVKALADQKDIQLDYQTLPQQKVAVMADPDRITEIVNNLISNAIKYSDQGTITITHESDGKNMTTHITDQGHGISPKAQKKIFTRFFRAEEAAHAPGTGLGLFIVKQMVEKMGGKIWFRSKLSQGTTFSFSLPLDGEHQLKEYKSTKPKKKTSPRRKSPHKSISKPAKSKSSPHQKKK